MPDCYFVAVTHSSSLDRDTNTWSLFTLVENLNIEAEFAYEEDEVMVFPHVELHTFWLLEPHEFDKEFQIRFVFVTEQGKKSSKNTYLLKSNKSRHRLRIRGLELVRLGKLKLQVEWKADNKPKWKMCSPFWPMEISYAERKPERNKKQKQLDL